MTIPVDLIPEFKMYCNQPDEVVWSQIKQNVRRGTPRLTFSRACIVGGGPSVADYIEQIVRRKKDGWHVFALNAAHDWLIREAAVVPTHHVLYDSRPLMADMVVNWRGDVHYYVSSQCHPSVFDALKNAARVTMFHSANYAESMDFFNTHEPGRLVLGGAPTVGMQALNLMVVLGYRQVELYGYDSSNRDGRRHAYRQQANEDQPEREFVLDGKTYRASAPMGQQAQYFSDTFLQWRDCGLDIKVCGDGLLPAMWRKMMGQSTGALEEREAAKYEAIWRHPAYRKRSPGAIALDHFLSVVRPPVRGRSGAVDKTRIIDFGCGPGRATQRLKDMGYDALGVDIASNALDADVMVPFCLAVLWQLPESLNGDYGYCCDVMEHIPTEKVDDVLAGIARAVPCAYFRIDYHGDSFGRYIGGPLHCTVRPESWWAETLASHWKTVNIVDGAFICRR